jgi:hypothetical protein
MELCRSMELASHGEMKSPPARIEEENSSTF